MPICPEHAAYTRSTAHSSHTMCASYGQGVLASIGDAGMLCDSDPAVSLTRHKYLPGTGMYGSVDIATLKGKPYPLCNWAVAKYCPMGLGF